MYLCGGPAALARLYGFQNPYLLLEYSSVARTIEHLFVGRWPEGPTSLKGGAMAPVGLSGLLRSSGERLDYDFLYFGDVVRHFCRMDTGQF